jgi:hypothetical protein
LILEHSKAGKDQLKMQFRKKGPVQIQSKNLSEGEAATRLADLMAMVGLSPSQTGGYPH